MDLYSDNISLTLQTTPNPAINPGEKRGEFGHLQVSLLTGRKEGLVASEFLAAPCSRSYHPLICEPEAMSAEGKRAVRTQGTYPEEVSLHSMIPFCCMGKAESPWETSQPAKAAGPAPQPWLPIQIIQGEFFLNPR